MRNSLPARAPLALIQPRFAQSLTVLLLVGTVVAFTSRSAWAQAQLADEIVLISKGLRAQENARGSTHLGTSPGAERNRFAAVPGSGAGHLGEDAVNFSPVQHDILAAAAAGPGAVQPGPEAVVTPPVTLARRSCLSTACWNYRPRRTPVRLTG